MPAGSRPCWDSRIMTSRQPTRWGPCSRASTSHGSPAGQERLAYTLGGRIMAAASCGRCGRRPARLPLWPAPAHPRLRTEPLATRLGLDGFFETSAKEGWQVTDLAQAIRDGIAWDALPMVSSSVLFDEIKRFLLGEKQEGRLLATADDLFRIYRQAHPDKAIGSDLLANFEACIGR